ncbi:amidase [Paenibacillus barcinonensis]|uniref:Amidase n=1 Tax=Paenibacillus barcinonensis TaxID=198119 RepID=A0A2V4VU14_PAEBA|nr:amidase family protein [Paenibacillus barcinonensis]PYE50622.1 amidase [Paenibacillus barcinonensis]QKS57316.1 amidase [Paenibacillus barcinonensis]
MSVYDENQPEELQPHLNKTGDTPPSDPWGAYVNAGICVPATQPGSLSGLSFAVKDVFDIKGHTSGAGNPDWLRTHSPAESTAPALLSLLQNGASLEGTTHTDELMYSLNGENAHYGTPTNPTAPDRIPGGSSSGSAVAAAAGLVDFAIGTDTGGSVRIPSSYCGLYGFRPTHGAISTEGLIPLAHSFDTVGWMSRDVNILLKAGRVLLKEKPTAPNEASAPQANASDDAQQSFELDSSPFTHHFIAAEAWSLPEAADHTLLLARLHQLPGWQPDQTTTVQLTETSESLAEWSAAFRVLQGLEIAHEHGEWIKKEQPKFGPGIAERFEWAQQLEPSATTEEANLRARIKHTLAELLGEHGLLAIPTAPGPAPFLGLKGPEAEAYRAKTMQLSCIAGLSGLPQITVPVIRPDGLPIGLSFIGGKHTDLRLLQWAVQHFTEEVHR